MLIVMHAQMADACVCTAPGADGPACADLCPAGYWGSACAGVWCALYSVASPTDRTIIQDVPVPAERSPKVEWG